MDYSSHACPRCGKQLTEDAPIGSRCYNCEHGDPPPPSPAAPEWTEPCAVCPDGNTCFNAETCLRASRQANQPPSPAAPAQETHGYGCPHDGDPLPVAENCVYCCRHGWVESAQGKPCPRCYPQPAPSEAGTPPVAVVDDAIQVVVNVAAVAMMLLGPESDHRLAACGEDEAHVVEVLRQRINNTPSVQALRQHVATTSAVATGDSDHSNERKGAQAGTPPVGEPALDENRCSICGWPLKATLAEGCTRGNCSMRPWPERYYDPARAAREYGEHLPPERDPYRPDPRDAELSRLRAQLAALERKLSYANGAVDFHTTRAAQAEQRAATARAEAFREAAQMVRNEAAVWFGDGKAALTFAADGVQNSADQLARAAQEGA